jgi:hypothetical protein
VARQSVSMPLGPHEEAIRLTGAHARVRRRAYIRCNRPPLPGLEGSAEKARSGGWPCFELPTGHDAMVTMPRELADVLLQLAARA